MRKIVDVRANLVRLPTGLVGMIFLVAIVESLLSLRISEFTADAASTWRWSGLSARNDGPRANILCLGDSLIKFGVAPKLIRDRSGRSACNLAVFQGSPPVSYLLLKHVLEAGGSPSAILVNGELLYQDPFEYPWLWPELANPREAAELAWNTGNVDFLAEFMASWAMPSIKAQQEIRANILAALQGKKTQTASAFTLNWRNWQANQGALMIPSTFKGSEREELSKLETPLAISGHWMNHPVNEIYVKKLLDLAEARKIRVFWLLPPKDARFIKRYDRSNWLGAYGQYLTELLDQYPNLIVVDGQRSGYEPSVMADLVHLNRRGASAYSLALGEIIRDRQDSRTTTRPRWITLPAYVEPGDGLVEDIEQTTFALKEEQEKRR
jgi:hypothetical protein